MSEKPKQYPPASRPRFPAVIFISFVKTGVRALAWIVLVGWAIYPIGYMCMDGGWLSGIMSPEKIDVWYNLADAINKIGFGLVVYNLAVNSK